MKSRFAVLCAVSTDSSPVDALRTGFTLPRIGLPTSKAGADLDILAFRAEYRNTMKSVAEEIDAGFLELDEELGDPKGSLYKEAMSDTFQS